MRVRTRELTRLSELLCMLVALLGLHAKDGRSLVREPVEASGLPSGCNRKGFTRGLNFARIVSI